MCTVKKREPAKVKKGDVVRVLPVGSIRPIGSYHVVVNAAEKRIVYTRLIHDGRTDQEDCEYCFRKDGIVKVPVIRAQVSERVINHLRDGLLPANISEDLEKWESIYEKFKEFKGECILKFTNNKRRESIYVQAQTCIKTIKKVIIEGTTWQEHLSYQVPQITLVGVSRI